MKRPELLPLPRNSGNYVYRRSLISSVPLSKKGSRRLSLRRDDCATKIGTLLLQSKEWVSWHSLIYIKINSVLHTPVNHVVVVLWVRRKFRKSIDSSRPRSVSTDVVGSSMYVNTQTWYYFVIYYSKILTMVQTVYDRSMNQTVLWYVFLSFYWHSVRRDWRWHHLLNTRTRLRVLYKNFFSSTKILSSTSS